MVKLSFVKKATVECVEFEDLKEGDFILWSNYKAKVVSIYRGIIGTGSKALTIQLFPEDDTNILEIPKYHTFFRIISAELKKVEV